MSDPDFWGTSGYEDDGEDVLVPGFDVVIEIDHQLDDTPAVTIQLCRHTAGYGERMTISGYPRISAVFVTCPAAWSVINQAHMPGVVRELPVGWRDMADDETFRACVERAAESYELHGWVRAAGEAPC